MSVRQSAEADLSYLNKHIIILDNQSSVTNPTLSRSYRAYAYVDGQHMYQSEYYPLLIALYMDVSG